MGKGKPRHNPDKPQNKIGGWCQLYHDKYGDSCPHYYLGDVKVCQGNPHMCIKNFYRGLARLTDKQKQIDNMPVRIRNEVEKRERWRKENEKY